MWSASGERPLPTLRFRPNVSPSLSRYSRQIRDIRYVPDIWCFQSGSVSAQNRG